MIVVIERARSSLSLDRHVDGRRVRKIDVRITIAVVVDQNHAAAHGFHNVFAVARRNVIEMNSRLAGDVCKLRDVAAHASHRLGTRRRRRRLRVRFLRNRQPRGKAHQRKGAQQISQDLQFQEFTATHAEM